MNKLGKWIKIPDEFILTTAHKAAEGIRMQVEASKGVRALIASTMPEVWQIIHSGVVEEGKVDDVSRLLHSLSPINESRTVRRRERARVSRIKRE